MCHSVCMIHRIAMDNKGINALVFAWVYCPDNLKEYLCHSCNTAMDLPQCCTFATTWGCNIYATLGHRQGGLRGILLYVHYTKTFSKDFPKHAKRNPPEELTSGGLHVISCGWWVLTVESGRVPKLYRKYLA